MPVIADSVQCGYDCAMVPDFWGTMTFMTIETDGPIQFCQVGAMLEKRIAESHASLERKFEHLAKQLLQPGTTALPGPDVVRCFEHFYFLFHLAFGEICKKLL